MAGQLPENANVCRFLAEIAKKQPGGAALIQPPVGSDTGKSTTFAEYASLVAGASQLLRSKGIRRGTRTLLMVRPGAELIILAFALFQIGAIPIVIDPGMGLKNFRACVLRSKPRALVGILPAVALSWYFAKEFQFLQTRILIGGLFLKHCKNYKVGQLEPAHANPFDLAAILFTSGSTGPPKGVCYEHRHFDAQLRIIHDNYGIQHGEVDLPLLPVFALFNPALGMATVVPPIDPSKPAKANPAKIVRALTDNKVTNSFGSPVLWKLIGEYCKSNGTTLPDLRRILMAGTSVPTEILELWTKIAPNAKIHTPYGATECLPVSSIDAQTLLGETSPLTLQGKGTCLGKTVQGVQASILPPKGDKKTSTESGREIGEIVVSGSVVTESYDQLPSATKSAKIDDDGKIWHRMGDLGYFDEQQRLWFCGRVLERVITQQGPLYTDCCEAIFNQHPKVFRSALIGLGTPGKQIPAIVIEPEKGLFPKTQSDRDALNQELRTLAQSNAVTISIEKFFFHHAFPVDVRHNAKIHRLTLAKQFS